MNDDEIGKVFGVVAVQGDLSSIIGQLNYVYSLRGYIFKSDSRIFNLQLHVHSPPEDDRPTRSRVLSWSQLPPPALARSHLSISHETNETGTPY